MSDLYKAVIPLDYVAGGSAHVVNTTPSVGIDGDTRIWTINGGNFTINNASDDRVILMDNFHLSSPSLNNTMTTKPPGEVRYTVTLVNGTGHQICRYCKVGFSFTLTRNAVSSLVIIGNVKTPWNTSTAKRLTVNCTAGGISGGIIGIITTPQFEVDWTDLTERTMTYVVSSGGGGLGTS